MLLDINFIPMSFNDSLLIHVNKKKVFLHISKKNVKFIFFSVLYSQNVVSFFPHRLMHAYSLIHKFFKKIFFIRRKIFVSFFYRTISRKQHLHMMSMCITQKYFSFLLFLFVLITAHPTMATIYIHVWEAINSFRNTVSVNGASKKKRKLGSKTEEKVHAW